MSRSNSLDAFVGKGVLKICSKFTGEHPCQSVISIKLKVNFIEIALWHGFSLVNLLHIFRTLFQEHFCRTGSKCLRGCYLYRTTSGSLGCCSCFFQFGKCMFKVSNRSNKIRSLNAFIASLSFAGNKCLWTDFIV